MCVCFNEFFFHFLHTHKKKWKKNVLTVCTSWTYCVCVLSHFSHVQLLCNPMDCSLCPWDFPGKNTGVGCHYLLQGIFPTQGFKPHLLSLLHWQADSLPSEPPGKSMKLLSCLLFLNSFNRFFGLQQVDSRNLYFDIFASVFMEVKLV